MDWINIHRSTLASEAMLEATPAQVATWLYLQSFCLFQENGGRVPGAKKWTARTWIRAAMLEAEELKGESPLWHWEGDDLVVEFYPVEKEKEFKAKSKGGREGAKRRWRGMAHPLAQPIASGMGEPVGDPLGQALAQPVGEPMASGMGDPMAELMRKGKERKQKEEEEHAQDDVILPSLEEVRAWAMGVAGVDPAYAEKKWRDTNEKHGWVAHGRLIDWRSRWKRFWEEDREGWFRKNKNAAGGAGNGSHPGRKAEDPEWWWTEEVGTLERALTGALLGGDASAARMREVLEARRAQ